MKIGIVGSGCSGMYLASLLLDANKNFDITLIDANETLGKKFLVTGNGRCNIANSICFPDCFSNNNIKISDDEVKKFFFELGIKTTNIDNYIYPYSLSSKTVVDGLEAKVKNKVKFIPSTIVKDYLVKNNHVCLITDFKLYEFEKVIFAIGGKSGNSTKKYDLLNIFANHGYYVKDFISGLAPMHTLEQTKAISNNRLKGEVKLIVGGEVLYKEVGEVIFKDEGISGICIFNISSILARKNIGAGTISINLMYKESFDEVLKDLSSLYKIRGIHFLEGIFTKPISDYILKVSHLYNLTRFNDADLYQIAKNITSLKFRVGKPYDFKDSQVSIGGIEMINLDDNFRSKLEKNVYFLGEIIDLDGLCGGYNLMLCYYEACKIRDDLIK